MCNCGCSFIRSYAWLHISSSSRSYKGHDKEVLERRWKKTPGNLLYPLPLRDVGRADMHIIINRLQFI